MTSGWGQPGGDFTSSSVPGDQDLGNGHTFSFSGGRSIARMFADKLPRLRDAMLGVARRGAAAAIRMADPRIADRVQGASDDADWIGTGIGASAEAGGGTDWIGMGPSELGDLVGGGTVADFSAMEEELQQRDRPVRTKKTRDPAWRNKPEGPLYVGTVEDDDDLGPVAVVSANGFFGELDERYNSTLEKLESSGWEDTESGMTGEQWSSLEAMARYQNDEEL
jgi:hypothetical protein